MKTTSNQFEHSLTIDNLDICSMKPLLGEPELILALKDQEGDPIQQIILSPEQVGALLTHLTDPRTQAVFKRL